MAKRISDDGGSVAKKPRTDTSEDHEYSMQKIITDLEKTDTNIDKIASSIERVEKELEDTTEYVRGLCLCDLYK